MVATHDAQHGPDQTRPHQIRTRMEKRDGIDRESDQTCDHDERDGRRDASENRIADVAAIQLADRAQVERRCEQTEPRRPSGWMQVYGLADGKFSKEEPLNELEE